MEAQQTVSCEFVYTDEDERAALAVMRVRKPLFSGSFLAWVFVLSMAALLFVVRRAQDAKRIPTAPAGGAIGSHDIFTTLVLNYGAYFAIALLGVLLVLRILFGKPRNWKITNAKEATRVTFAPSGLLLETHESQTENKWTRYVRVVEGRTGFVLVLPEKSWYMIPKRVMTPVQIDQVRNLLAANVGKAKGFPVTPA